MRWRHPKAKMGRGVAKINRGLDCRAKKHSMITSKNVRATEEGSQLSRELYLIMVAATPQGSQLRDAYLKMVGATE